MTKYFIRGIICGLILGGGIVYFVYKYNIPGIEKIKYITIHDLSINNISKNLLPSKKEKVKSQGQKSKANKTPIQNV